MSTPATQYVYIPNLVGRQMLRIAIDDVEAESHITASSPQTTTSTSATQYTRDSSPSPSIEQSE
ncbi:hypothetical protein GQ44DRAFT_26838 [Phaeosphaeriaceae sp. PMI808]|nr:hypothetical protein GQ44DRAFT_26838 [Phaeosphaeriaceae sp. PMI808]